MTDKKQPEALRLAAPAQPVAILFEHEDGRYAINPDTMGEPATQPAYGAIEYGWTDYRQLEEGDKRLIALVVGLYGNDHQSFTDLEGLLVRASHGQAPAWATPVHLDHIACIDGGELRYMTGRKAPAYDCELYAMPNGGSAPQLYAAPTTHPAPQLPERDANVPAAEQQGLFRKFDVRRVDGSDQPGGKHHGCRYFVLDVDHDPRAHAALTAYAAACESSHPKLAADLRSKWGAAPTTQPAPQQEAQEPDFWTVCAQYEGGDETGWIPLPGYSNETEHGVKNLVLQAARKEGYKGTVTGRLMELNWEIRPVYLAPWVAPQPSPAARGAAPVAELVTTAHGFETTLSLLPGHFDLPYGTHLLYAAPQPAAQALDAWQPIESAPKDGTYILLGSADGSWIARNYPVYQSGYRPDNPWQSMMLNHEHMGRYPKAKPTHWMPLPPAPSTKGESNG